MVMSLCLLAVALGNAFTALVNALIVNADGTTSITGADYYLFFVILMLATSLLFVPYSCVVHERAVLQGDAGARLEPSHGDTERL